jgi:hypothetical protein
MMTKTYEEAYQPPQQEVHAWLYTLLLHHSNMLYWLVHNVKYTCRVCIQVNAKLTNPGLYVAMLLHPSCKWLHLKSFCLQGHILKICSKFGWSQGT